MQRAAVALSLLALAAEAWAAGPVAVTAPEAAPDGPPLPATACIEHLQPGSKPDFPRLARQRAVRGRIVAVVHFDAADRPPVVELLHRPTAHVLREAVEAWAEGLRRPCHAGARFSTQYTFDFQFIGETARLRPVQLADLLALARQRQHRTAAALGDGARCPLSVRWQYLQPYRANRVQVIGPAQPGHGPIIEQLAGLELALTRVAADAAWGDTTTIEIPCHTSQNPPKE